MPVDPVTATAAVAITAKWMWDSYGKNAVGGLAQRLGRSRERAQVKREWQAATQTYLTKLHAQVNWLRLLGKREGMPLEQIFTDLNVLDKLSAEQWYSRDALQQDFLQRHGFHERLKEARQDGLTVVKQFPRLYILGKPGAGKTTFLKYVTLEALKGRLGQKLPLFVSLKELSDAELSILPFMAEQLRQCGFAEAEPFLRQLLAKGDAIVLFDGLDEVNLEEDKRAKQIAAMRAFVREFDQCQVLITCRIAASDYSFERFKYVEMADFNETQQKTFIFRWFHDDLPRRDACWSALQVADKAGLRELAQVPLLLTLLCLTFERRGEFPPDRDEIYRWAVNALLFEWDSNSLIQRDALYKGLDVKYRERLLAWIAAQTFDKEEYLLEETRLAELIEQYLRTVPRLEGALDGLGVLKAIEAHHGLLVERAQGIYSFSHLTLQEYFTARHIVDNAAAGTLPRLMRHVGDDRWREVFLLTAGMLSDATDFSYLYLKALSAILENSEILLRMMEWTFTHTAISQSGVDPCALRALTMHWVLSYEYDHELVAYVTTGILPQLRNFGRDRVSSTARLLSVALDMKLAQVFRNVELLDEGRDRIRYNAYTDHDQDLDRKPELQYNRDLAIARSFAEILVRGLVLHLASLYDLSLIQGMQNRIDSIFQYLLKWLAQKEQLETLKDSLSVLRIPSQDDRPQLWEYLCEQLNKCIKSYWGWPNLSGGDFELLFRYLEANLMLVQILDIASLPDRQAVKSQMLLLD